MLGLNELHRNYGGIYKIRQNWVEWAENPIYVGMLYCWYHCHRLDALYWFYYLIDLFGSLTLFMGKRTQFVMLLKSTAEIASDIWNNYLYCNTPVWVAMICRYRILKTSMSLNPMPPWRAIGLRHFIKIKNLGNSFLDIVELKRDF